LREEKMKIGIVNYGLGNVGSVYSAFRFYKCDVSLVINWRELKGFDVIVLSGVGNFETAVFKLRELTFLDELK